MLTRLFLQDFAIIDRLEVEFGPGMTVLTGETGAGKSILIDALGLALGERADTTAIRDGCDKAEVVADFNLETVDQARSWLAAQELDSDGSCLIRRVISPGGRSKAFINGRPVPLQSVRELGDLLVDIHGQHEHQSLLRTVTQMALVDGYGGLEDSIRSVAAAHRDWHAVRTELEGLRGDPGDQEARAQLLGYQLRELEALALEEGELEQLQDEQKRLAAAGRLLETTQRAVDEIYADDPGSLLTRVAALQRSLGELTGIDDGLAPALELLDNAEVQLKEAAGELRHYLADLELDPERRQGVEQRLDAIHDLARKHRVAPEFLHLEPERLAQELALLENADERRRTLEARLTGLEADYRRAAGELSRRRREAAQHLQAEVTDRMQQLGMKGGRFAVMLEPRAEGALHPNGLERAVFLVSANPGQAERPLNKVASGGELSRISLAIQVATANTGTVPTLIFDEVDVGIGGGVAETVGRELRQLGRSRQVLTVTHLAQVAAQGEAHLQVRKKVSKKKGTRTEITPLDAEDRTAEIGRMLGGREITDNTLAHAREMLQRARETPN